MLKENNNNAIMYLLHMVPNTSASVLYVLVNTQILSLCMMPCHTLLSIQFLSVYDNRGAEFDDFTNDSHVRDRVSLTF